MRGVHLFVTGILVGLVMHMATAQNRIRGSFSLNHVAISVADLDAALRYYTEVMGFPEAFRVADEAGKPTLVYVQISGNTFVELQAASEQRPPGINHFGVQVEDMDAATVAFRGRGADIDETHVGSTMAILSNIRDPYGNRIELLELPPESLHRQATARWH